MNLPGWMKQKDCRRCWMTIGDLGDDHIMGGKETMKSLAQSIEKARYTESWFDVSAMRIGRKETYEFYPNGRVIFRLFEGSSRKSSYHMEYLLSPKTISEFFARIEGCIHSADQVMDFVDDCGGELKLSFFGGEMVLPRGFGNSKNYIGGIVSSFVEEIRRQQNREETQI